MCLSHALTIGPSRMRDLLDASALKVGFIVFSDGPVAPGGDADGFMIFGKPVSGFSRSARPGDTDENRVAQRHFEVWREQVDAVREHFPNHCEFINSHSCKDYFTVGMAERFFDEALAHDKDVMHEGHRKRLCVCFQYISLIPSSQLLTSNTVSTHLGCAAIFCQSFRISNSLQICLILRRLPRLTQMIQT